MTDNKINNKGKQLNFYDENFKKIKKYENEEIKNNKED